MASPFLKIALFLLLSLGSAVLGCIKGERETRKFLDSHAVC